MAGTLRPRCRAITQPSIDSGCCGRLQVGACSAGRVKPRARPPPNAEQKMQCSAVQCSSTCSAERSSRSLVSRTSFRSVALRSHSCPPPRISVAARKPTDCSHLRQRKTLQSLALPPKVFSYFFIFLFYVSTLVESLWVPLRSDTVVRRLSRFGIYPQAWILYVLYICTATPRRASRLFSVR